MSAEIQPNNIKLQRGLKEVRSRLDGKLHAIRHEIIKIITQEMQDDAKVVLLPPSQHVGKEDVKVSFIYEGELTDDQKAKVKEVLGRYKNANYLAGKLNE